MIDLILKTHLKTNTSIALLTGAREQSLLSVHASLTQRAHAKALLPIYLVIDILCERFENHSNWFASLRRNLTMLESSTGMTPTTWQGDVPENIARWLADYDNLLHFLHATHTEMCHCETVAVYNIKLGEFCLEMVTKMEALRKEVGCLPWTKAERVGVREAIEEQLGDARLVEDRLKEILQRLRGQINVVSMHFSLSIFHGTFPCSTSSVDTLGTYTLEAAKETYPRHSA